MACINVLHLRKASLLTLFVFIFRLAMREAGLGQFGGIAVAAMFLEHPVFTVLDLSGNNLKDQGSKAVCALWNHNLVSTSIVTIAVCVRLRKCLR